MTATKTAIPEDLIRDFGEIQCCCEHGDGQCTNSARIEAVIHCIGQCEDPRYAPHGNIAELLCMECFTNLAYAVVETIVRMMMWHTALECQTCRAPVRTPHDVIREVRPL